MAVYKNTNSTSSLTSVEFIPVAEGNFTFFYLNNPRSDKEALKQWLTSKEIDQEIVAETVVDNRPVFVTKGDKSQDEMTKALEERGDKVTLQLDDKKFNAWKWRGMMSNVGQSLNLLSAGLKPSGIDKPKMMFAGLNFAASWVNATFGGQKSEDEYQLNHMKTHINQLLGKHLPEGQKPFDIHDDRADLRQEPQQPKTMGQKFHDFMAANSVRLGEIGLRYLGSIAMAFPMANWGKAYQQIRKGSWAGAFAAAKNSDTTNFWTGITYLTGKSIGMFSKVPDPYNPAPHTTIDTIREKVLFRLSSSIEACAAGILAVGNFKKNKEGKRDYIGGVGGAALTSGLLIRLFADFGTRKVDMEELYAHTTDTLARTPPDKLPQLIAESAASLKEHFKSGLPGYGQVYTHMMSELYRYHHISLDNLGTEPEERIAKMKTQGAKPVEAAAEPAAAKFALANPSRTIAERAGTPADNFAEAVSKTSKIIEPTMGLSA